MRCSVLQWLSAVFLAAWAGGCIDTGQDRVNFPLFVAGTDVSEQVLADDDTPVTIDRADLAFGPLYLCAGTTAGDLCDTARAEWLDTTVVDGTLPEPVLAGSVLGLTGTVRSWMYDLGISSQLTRDEPFVLEAAEELGGVSLILEGRATVSGINLPFSAAVPISQSTDTELGVPVVRKGSEDFFRDIAVGELSLLIRFDPAAWVRGINFSRQVANETCRADGPSVVCDGTLERTCDESGTESSQRDCSGSSQVCLPQAGCADRWIIERDSEAFRSISNALVSRNRPSFEWDEVP